MILKHCAFTDLWSRRENVKGIICILFLYVGFYSEEESFDNRRERVFHHTNTHKKTPGKKVYLSGRIPVPQYDTLTTPCSPILAGSVQ